MFVWVQVLLSSLGRERYPTWVLSAFVAVVSLVALSGVQEYLSPSVPRNWRIFAGWHHPNAAASLFALALPISLALALAASERAARALSAVGFGLIGAALWLTASKGGLAAALIGLAALALLLSFHRIGRWKGALAPLVCLAVLFVGVQGLKAVTSPATESTSRLTATQQEGEQSLAFRNQVWSDTLFMIEERPLLGFGPGTYGTEFKRYSQVQAPVFAHNAYLQIAAESGVPAVLLLLVVFVVGLYAIIVRNPAQSPERALLRFGCAASLVVLGANAFVDSTLSVFGYAIAAFTILPVGLLLSADGAQAEKVPLANRIFALAIPSVAAGLYLFLAFVSIQTATSAYASAQRSGAWSSPPRLAPLDPVPYDLEGRFRMEQGKPKQALTPLLRAKALDPTPARHAALAEALELTGEHKGAVRELLYAHEAEPANPRWLATLLRIEQAAGHTQDAEKVANDLVAMEGSLFFRLRSLPWLVELSTLDAHLFLADRAAQKGDRAEQIKQLRAAYDLLRDYRLKTTPELLRQTGLFRVYEARENLGRRKNGPITALEIADELGLSMQEFTEYLTVAAQTPLAGETVVRARNLSLQLRDVGYKLAELLQQEGRESEAVEIRREAASLVLPPIGLAGL
ncbi:MAG: hypothetical protein KatS3mg015_1616 [Fimbriimonadales bacterium]|nr:MAG: hypothetical protein KatS3mg015_1616 [Fimbriimonadales bacterium]